ncbi:MAG TPA: hypothetical protein DCZ03_10875, partial [Gammaproteobacteria bacterium]|nr:hypothetical protein [Gammaproteobacteria bacterium]
MIRSVTRHLLITQISFLFLVLVVLVTWNYLDSYKEIEGIFDAQLSRSAHTLNSLLSFADEEGYLESLKLSMGSFEEHLMQQDFSHSYDRRIIFQIWQEPGGLLLKSSQAPEFPLTESGQGFVEEILNENSWRVYVFSHPLMRYRFYVGERSDLRREVATKLALRSTLPLFILFPILAFVIWRSIVRALTFINTSAKRIEEEVPENLEPISLEDVPTEVHPLIRALNGLFVKINESYEREKRFSADAAHELRTPLTAIKTQAQVAMREADDNRRQKALENVVKGVDAAAHLAEQLLSLSRLEDHKVVKTDLNLVDLIND